MKTSKIILIILISVIISVVITFLFIIDLPSLYSYEVPEANWWAALTTLIALSGISFIYLHHVLDSVNKLKNEVSEVQEMLKRFCLDYQSTQKKDLGLVSNLIELQELSETSSDEHWEKVKDNIKGFISSGSITSYNLRILSVLAWKQEKLDITEPLSKLQLFHNIYKIKYI